MSYEKDGAASVPFIDCVGATIAAGAAIVPCAYLATIGFNVTGDSGTQFIDMLGDTASFVGGLGIRVSVTATDVISFVADLTDLPADASPTIASLAAVTTTYPDGARVTPAKVVQAISSVAFDSAQATEVLQVQSGAIVRTSIPTVAIGSAVWGNLFLSSDGIWKRPRHRWNWQASAITSNVTVDLATNDAFRVDATAGNVTVTVPTPATTDSYEVIIKRHDASANTVTVVFTPTIDGAASITLAANAHWGGTRGESITGSWSGSEWSII